MAEHLAGWGFADGSAGFVDPNLGTIAKYIIVKASSAPQLGSMPAYIQTLIDLTTAYPQVWLQAKGGKGKTPLSIFAKLVSKGSQGGREAFWGGVHKLLDLLPEDMIPTTPQAADEFLDVFLRGVNGPQEVRNNMVAGWKAYLGACRKILCLNNLPEETTSHILDSRLAPVYEEYLKKEGKAEFRLEGSYALRVCVDGLVELAPSGLVPLFDALWQKTEQIGLDGVRKGGQAKGADSEQLVEVVRWLELVSGLYQSRPDDAAVQKTLRASYGQLVVLCIEVLNTPAGEYRMSGLRYYNAEVS